MNPNLEIRAPGVGGLEATTNRFSSSATAVFDTMCKMIRWQVHFNVYKARLVL